MDAWQIICTDYGRHSYILLIFSKKNPQEMSHITPPFSAQELSSTNVYN